MSDFKFDFKDFQGSFKLKLDSDVMKERFSFGIEIDGRYKIYPPLFISPLGVPASYSSIELTEETEIEIKKLLNNYFPKVKPFGIDRETGQLITGSTSMEDRLFDPDGVEIVKEEILKEKFQLSYEIQK